MKLNVAICEDEKILSNIIKSMIREDKPEYEITMFCNGEELLLSDKEYDIVFLDIDLPGKDGISVARELRANNYTGYIIFQTGYTEYMPEAFEVKAFRFLTKPISSEEISRTLNVLEKDYYENNKKIIFDERNQLYVNASDVLYIKADNNYSLIYTNNNVISIKKPLKILSSELGTEDFVQVHRSYLVSLKNITKIAEDGIHIDNNDIKIPVSRRCFSNVRKTYAEYMKKHTVY